MNELQRAVRDHRTYGHDLWVRIWLEPDYTDEFIYDVCAVAHCNKRNDPRGNRDDMSDNLLRDLQFTLDSVNFQIQAAYRLAEKNGIENVYDMQNVHGDFVLIPLLVTKAQLLVAIKKLRRSEIIPVVYPPKD